MYPLGLNDDDRAAFHLGLVRAHEMRVQVRILDMDHNVLGTSTGRVISGQVDVSATAPVTRSAGLTILDPDHELNLDSSATFGGSLFLDRMVQITYGVKSAELPRWIDVPIFTGPIDDLSRDGEVVNLSAIGKESLLLGPASTHRTWKAGSYKTTVLRELLSMFGEAFTEIPHQSTKTTKPLSVAPVTIPWDYIQSVARSWGSGRIMYDGAGYARFIGTNNNPQWTFRGGADGSLLSKPMIGYDAKDARNFIVVVGAAPAKGGKPVSALAHAPSAHPLSADNLGRNGVRRYLREDINDTNVTTQAAAQELADTVLKERLNTAVQLDYTGLVIPHLEPWDVVAVNHGVWGIQASLTDYTIPLTADGKMSIGRRYTVHRHTRERMTARKGPRKG